MQNSPSFSRNPQGLTHHLSGPEKETKQRNEFKRSMTHHDTFMKASTSLPHMKTRTWLMLISFLMFTCFSSLSLAEIFAQSGYGSGQDGVLLLTERCPADRSGELQVAVARTGSRVRQGCYVVNNRGNAIVKWDDGSIQELDWNLFGRNSLKLSAAAANGNGFSAWEFFSGKTTQGTSVCGLFTSNSDKKNIRNVSIKQLANQDSMNVTLYNDRWTLSRAASVSVVLDFGDNQPLKLPAYSDGKILDISLAKEVTATFLSLMADQNQIRLKPEISKEKVWSVPLRNIQEPLKQFVECALAQRNK